MYMYCTCTCIVCNMFSLFCDEGNPKDLNNDPSCLEYSFNSIVCQKCTCSTCESCDRMLQYNYLHVQYNIYKNVHVQYMYVSLYTCMYHCTRTSLDENLKKCNHFLHAQCTCIMLLYNMIIIALR